MTRGRRTVTSAAPVARSRPVPGARWAACALLLVASLASVQCATNPATGKAQIAFISEEREVEMGREADGQIGASMGMVDDPALAAYVDRIGQALAATSERSHLDWTFRVIDDPTVNAFALPGGFIYVTRGILAHMNNEAELAGVVGHEIGHVTGKHSVNQLSKQQLGGAFLAGVSVAAAVSDAWWAGLAEAGAQMGTSLMFMKFSRSHEQQADDLGLRYMRKGGYDPQEMPGVFAMLEAVGEQAEGGRVPGWLSTHPNPDARGERSVNRVARLGPEAQGGRVGEEDFLDAIGGIAFGANPREGYFRETLFLHPEMEFQLDFPDGWATQNQRTQVLAANDGQEVLLQLTLADADSATEGARSFLSQEGVEPGRRWNQRVNGLQAAGGAWSAAVEGGTLAGVVAFIEHGGEVFRLLAIGEQSDFAAERAAVRDSMRSFRTLQDPRVLAVEPYRLQIVEVELAMTLRGLARRMSSPVEVETLAVVNRVDPDVTLEAGRRLKMVVGEPPP